MHPFTKTRTRRRTAFTLLLVWLFALGSGWANACLLQERGTHSHVSPTDPLPSAQALNLSPGHLGMDDDHPDNAGAAKGICLKVCDDGTQSIVEQASGFDVPHVVMASPLTLPWRSPLAAAAAHNAWLELPAPGAGPPLRTRLSRLAL